MTAIAIWAATQKTRSEDLVTLEQLTDTSKSKNFAQKGIIWINSSICNSSLSSTTKKVLLSLMTSFVMVISAVAHLILYTLGHALSVLSAFAEFYKNPDAWQLLNSLCWRTTCLALSPGFAFWGMVGSTTIQIRTIGAVKADPVPATV